eukprot:NODE_327_length_9598_cov_1.179914.p7 type:complete len:159 gc:universal NODE_327_length_9598_cov_1.179914:4348-4824(+)
MLLSCDPGSKNCVIVILQNCQTMELQNGRFIDVNTGFYRVVYRTTIDLVALGGGGTTVQLSTTLASSRSRQCSVRGIFVEAVRNCVFESVMITIANTLNLPCVSLNPTIWRHHFQINGRKTPRSYRQMNVFALVQNPDELQNIHEMDVTLVAIASQID